MCWDAKIILELILPIFLHGYIGECDTNNYCTNTQEQFNTFCKSFIWLNHNGNVQLSMIQQTNQLVSPIIIYKSFH